MFTEYWNPVAFGSKGPPARMGAVTWIDQVGNLLLYGGRGAGRAVEGSAVAPVFGDIWKFDLRKEKWKEMQTGMPRPAFREDALSWSGPRNSMLIAGGWGAGDESTSALWEWRAASGWRRIAADVIPFRRAGSVTWTHEGRLYVYGGTSRALTSRSSVAGDVWSYDISNGCATCIWDYEEEQNRATQRPVWRTHAAYTTFGDAVYVFGGLARSNRGDVLEDFWRFERSTGMPTLLSSGGPPARCGGSLVAHNNGNLYLFGGTGAPGRVVSDLWKFSLVDSRWERLDQPEAGRIRPSPRSGAATWICNDGAIWLFGGYGAEGNSGESKALGDLWRLNL